MRTTWFVLAAAAALAACAPESSGFVATIDAAPIDADPGAAGIAVMIEPTSIAFGEGDTETLRVHLAAAPSAPVQVDITGVAGVADVEPESLTFDADDWPNDQLVTVTAIDDNDAEDENGAILFDDAGDTVMRASVAVDVDDPDMFELVTSVDSLSIGEVGSGDVLVHLSAAPTTELVVDVRVVDMTAATVDITQLRFNPDTWQGDQTVTVRGADDADVNNESTYVELDGGGAVPTKSLGLTVVDNDVLNIQVDAGTVNIVEGGTNGTIGVSLTQDPGTPLTVTLAESSPGFHLGQTSIQFSSSNYSEVHSIAVIPDDDVDITDEVGDVTLSASPVMLDNVTVGVNVDDDDHQEIIHDVGGSLSVTQGSTATFNVSLKWRPAATTTVTIDSNDDSSATPVQMSVTIEPNNYADPHPVVISGVVDDDLVSETPSLTLSATDIPSKSISVAVTDPDVQSIELNPTAVTIIEGTTSMALTARLGKQPLGPVDVTVSSNNAAITVGGTSQTLSFTTNNWNMARPISLTAPTDSNEGDEQATISFSGGGATNSATATVDDQTMIKLYGWSTYFGQTITLNNGSALAYKVSVPANVTLDKFALITESAGGTVKMALYSGLNAPDTRIAAVNTATAITSAAPTPSYVDVADVAITAGTYWIAVTFENATPIGYSSSTTVNRCTKAMTYVDPWTTPFGTSNCTMPGAVNVFLVTY